MLCSTHGHDVMVNSQSW